MNIDLENLLELASAATMGEWTTDGHTSVNGGSGLLADTCFVRDAAFIAAANPQVVIALIEELLKAKKKIEQFEYSTSIFSKMANDNIVAMQAAVIAADKTGAEEGMVWIRNTLSGPGLLPEEGEEWADDPQLYYSHNCSDPFGPCGVCGKPSNHMRSGKVACCREHLNSQVSVA